jgi:major membrane immunogen (membrane-anchored lipoprotein)
MSNMKKRLNYLPSFLVAILFIVCAVNSNAATYHFSSTAGDDSRSAAQAQNESTPWRSIQKLNSIFQTLQPGDKILFKSGDVFHGEIVISRSGNPGAPIFFGSYGTGPKPIITGLTKIASWTSRGGNLYEANIAQLDHPVNVVVVDNVIAAKGRFPNENTANKGYLTIQSAGNGFVTSSELQAPANFSGAEVVIRKNNWIIDRHTINSHSGTTVNYNPTGSSYGPIVGYGFFIQNHPATLDQNGEWFHDRQNNKVLIYYDKGNPNNKVEVATVGEIINIQNNVSNLTFNNLRITGSNKNLIAVRSSSNIRLEDCELDYIGENAINSGGSKDLLVENTKISNALNGGVFLGWNDSGTKIRNSSFTNIFIYAGMGKNDDMQSQAIFMGSTTSNASVEYNSFINCGYNAINFNGNDITVNNNYINTFCFVKDDGGGIYTFTGSSQTQFVNRKVQNNIIVNGVGAQEGTKPFGAADFPYVEGIYLDSNTANVEISGNTIADVKSSGIYFNNSRNINFHNNSIYNAGYSLKFGGPNFGEANRNIRVRDNYFLQKTDNQLHVYIFSRQNQISDIGDFDNNIYARPVNDFSTIFIITPSGQSRLDLENWKERFNIDKNSKRSPVPFPNGKITSINGGNKINNGTYDANNNNATCWSANGNCNVDINPNSPLDGRALRVNAPSPSLVTISIGAIEKNKKYNLKLSGISNKNTFINAFLRENQSPWVMSSDQKTIDLTTSRKEIDLIFTATETRSNAALLLQTFDNNITFHIDNVVLQEVEIEEINPDSFFFFEYNKSLSPSNIPLPGSFVNLRGVNFNNSAQAQPYGSVLLLRTDDNYEAPVNDVKVKITEPTNQQKFEEPDFIKIGVSIEKSNSTVIEKVEIYNRESLLKTLTEEPYVFNFEKPEIGDYVLSAKAFDNKNSVFESEKINVSVIKKNQAPKVTITSPKAGNSFLEGENIKIEANATDSDGSIKSVEFFYNNTLIGTVTQSPYNIIWNKVPAGNHQLTVKAIDNLGGTSISEPVNINVAKPLGAPTVKITSPAPNSIFDKTRTITVRFEANSPNGNITKIELFKNNNLIGTANGNPNNVTFSLDNLQVGTFNLVAKVFDDKGATAVSTPLKITIVEPNIVPNINITNPKNGDFFLEGTDIRIEADAEDPDGEITKVEFYRGATLIGTSTSAPHSAIFSKAPAGNYNLTAKAFDNKGGESISPAINITVSKGNVAPSVMITSPKSGDIFIQGANIVIEANAQDIDGKIVKVEFYRGSVLIGTSNTAPFKITWANVPAGTYNLTAKAFDDKGDTKTSAPVKITINKSNVVPSITIISPKSGDTFIQGANIVIEANAQDTDGKIVKVEFYHGNVLIGTSNTAPFKFTWANVPAGTYNLTAKAFDDKGAVKTSSQVKITVNNSNVVPSVMITSPKSGDTFIQGSNIVIEANAQDTDGKIVKVEFYRGNVLIGTSNTSPFKITWANVPAGSFNLTAKAFDDKGAVKTSAPVNITIKPKIEIPWIELVTPVSDQEFDAGSNIVFTVMFGGSDEHVSIVEYYQGNQLIGTSSNSPFGFEWKNVAPGDYSVKAIAKGGNPEITKESQEVNISVKTVINPNFRIVSPITNSTIPSGSDLDINVEVPTSVKKIKRVEFYRGNQILGSNNKAPYNYIWKNVPKGEINLVARLIYEDNSVILSAVVKIFVVEEVIPSVILDYKFDEAVDKGDKPRILFEVSFEDLKSQVTEVEYFANGISLGVSDREPFNFIWENIEAGTYLIEAVAKDLNGLLFYSEEITLEIPETKKEEEISFSYVIGPNPTSDYLNIIFDNLKEDAEFEILVVSMNGNISETFKTKTVNSNITLDLSSLRRGSYILYLNNGLGYISSVKFIKK